jgi:hypothetical protein
MLTRILLFVALTAAPSFAADLSKADIERAGNLCAQALRPTIILNYEIEATTAVFGGPDRATCVNLLKKYAGQVEMAASYHRETTDLTSNPELLRLANSLCEIRRDEAKLCANLIDPNPAADALSFLGQSAVIGMRENDPKRAAQLREKAFFDGLMGHIGSQLQLNADGVKIVSQEKDAAQKLLGFLAAHPELQGDSDFEGPTRTLLSEHKKRGEAMAASLKRNPDLLTQSLLGLSSDRLGWTFDQADKIISVQVNDQKCIGICAVSDVTIVAQGQRAGLRTLTFKVAHEANRLGAVSVIALN